MCLCLRGDVRGPFLLARRNTAKCRTAPAASHTHCGHPRGEGSTCVGKTEISVTELGPLWGPWPVTVPVALAECPDAASDLGWSQLQLWE